MRTTVDLPDPLFRELKTRAARQGVKMKELLTRFVEEGLSANSGARARQEISRSPLPIARPRSGMVIPALSNEQLARILDAEDAGLRH